LLRRNFQAPVKKPAQVWKPGPGLVPERGIGVISKNALLSWAQPEQARQAHPLFHAAREHGMVSDRIGTIHDKRFTFH
jgi:hypothetical protein